MRGNPLLRLAARDLLDINRIAQAIAFVIPVVNDWLKMRNTSMGLS